MNSRFRAGRQFHLSIRFMMIVQFLLQNQLLPIVNALNGIIWDKKSSNFVSIFSIKQFAETKEYYFSLSRAMETYDFNGTQLKLTAFPLKNLFEFTKNNTESRGAHGEIWELLSKMLNFKILYIRSAKNEFGKQIENGSWTGLMGYIYRNETDVIPRIVWNGRRHNALEFLMPIWSTGYKLCVRKNLEYDRVWMTRLFTPSLWASVFGLFFTLAVTSFLLHALSYKKYENSTGDSATLSDHFFHMFSIFCNQGWVSPRFEKYSKILMLSTRFCAWLICIAFSSKLISHITQRQFREPFDDLDSLYYDTDYKIILRPNSILYSTFQNATIPSRRKIFASKRLINIGREIEPFSTICTGRNAYFEAEDVIRASDPKFCDIACMRKTYYYYWIGSAVVRGFKYKRTLDLWIIKLHEVGIVDRLKSFWLRKSIEIARSDSIESIRLVHVSLIFGMLCCAFILSLGILLIENIVYRKRCRKR